MAIGVAWVRPRALTWALVLVGGEYALWLGAGSRDVDVAAPIIAALLVAAAEFGHESLAFAEVDAVEGAVVAALIGRVAAAAIVGAALGALLLLIGGAKLSPGFGFEVLGLASAAAAMGLIAALARRISAEPGSGGADGSR
jgi:hypothetical protein